MGNNRKASFLFSFGIYRLLLIKVLIHLKEFELDFIKLKLNSDALKKFKYI